MTELWGIAPYDQAAGVIDSWRGRCLNLFARAEHAVSKTLEAGLERDGAIKIRHLAGQRLGDLTTLVQGQEMTAKQRDALTAALADWAHVELKRAYLAHGVVLALLDKQSCWHVQLDFTAYRGSAFERCRWNLSGLEAEAFEKQLATACHALSAQLGHFRKRLAA
jgi:hypothetical protein